MRMNRLLIATAALVAVACGSDDVTSPSPDRAADPRLSAVAADPVADITSSTVTMKVSVSSTLSESVSGGVCAQSVEARTASATTWTDVTANSFACSALAAVLAPGSTLILTAAADPAKIKTVAGSAASVLLRARSSLAGASTSYLLQSNEVTYQVP